MPLFFEQTKKVSFFQQTVKPSVKALYENDRSLQGWTLLLLLLLNLFHFAEFCWPKAKCFGNPNVNGTKNFNLAFQSSFLLQSSFFVEPFWRSLRTFGWETLFNALDYQRHLLYFSKLMTTLHLRNTLEHYVIV
jgi:hypothetical protein